MTADTNPNLHNVLAFSNFSELYLIFGWIQIRKYESKIKCITPLKSLLNLNWSNLKSRMRLNTLQTVNTQSQQKFINNDV